MRDVYALGTALIVAGLLHADRSALKLSLSTEYGQMEKQKRAEQPRGEIIDSTKESKRAKRRRLRKQTT